jgi:hypothetical protein
MINKNEIGIINENNNEKNKNDEYDKKEIGILFKELLKIEIEEEIELKKTIIEEIILKNEEIKLNNQQLKDLFEPILNMEELLNLEKYFLIQEIIQKYIPFILNNKEVFKAFTILYRLLLLYHDSTLSLHFDSNRIDIEIYLEIWMKNLFSKMLKNPLKLWEFFFNNDPLLTIYFSIALLIENRTELLNCVDKTLEIKLKQLDINEKQYNILFEKTKDIDKNTPLSTRNQLYQLFYPSQFLNIDDLKKYYQNNLVLPIPV